MRDTPIVHIVDPDCGAVETVRALLGTHGARVQQHRTARDLICSHNPDQHGCVLAEASLPAMGVHELLGTFAERRHGIPVIVISHSSEAAFVVDFIKAGATDFLARPLDSHRLRVSVEQAFALDEERRWRRVEAVDLHSRMARLTDRERQVLDLVVAGNANKMIAAHLSLSPKTIESHRATLMRKLDTKCVADLVRAALTVERHIGVSSVFPGKHLPSGMRHMPMYRGSGRMPGAVS